MWICVKVQKQYATSLKLESIMILNLKCNHSTKLNWLRLNVEQGIIWVGLTTGAKLTSCIFVFMLVLDYTHFPWWFLDWMLRKIEYLINNSSPSVVNSLMTDSTVLSGRHFVLIGLVELGQFFFTQRTRFWMVPSASWW